MTGQRRRPAGNDVLHEQQPPSHVSGDENMNEATTSSGSTESTASSESAEITTSSSSSASIPMVARAACPSPNIPSQIGGTRASHPKETIDLQIGTRVPKLYWLVEKYPIHRKIGHLMMVCMRDRGYHPSDKWVYDGTVVLPSDTPASLGMDEENMARIEVFVYQLGG
ncbi:hypothetical protein BKA70DRAFT_1451938 [Coprinopsis sp. MPI-PUGE-AT-0042]|nr:hypothetical protein BKA70DRAFT_1451938 [Coprinopsis sp. MPI-PUGE-AT-0042]